MKFTSEDMIKGLFLEPAPSNPYYIVSHAYTRKSAGIKVLHLLCDALNRCGKKAYLIVYPQFNFVSSTSPHLYTPLLTNVQILSDFERGLTPITIYPEVIGKNIFSSPVAFEYLLNFKGVLGLGSTNYDLPQIAYSEQIRLKSSKVSMNLFIPTSDPRVYHPPKKELVRQGIYYYAAKYQSLFGKLKSPPEPNAIEIIRNGLGSQTVEELVNIYQTARRIYVYENTAVATEAAMCGCPVVFMPSEFLEANITKDELGADGMAWGRDAAEIEKADKTVHNFYGNYLASYARSEQQLQAFIEYTQTVASAMKYDHCVSIPHLTVIDAWLRLLGLTYGFAQRLRYRLSQF